MTALRQFDLNLLRVMDAVMQQGSVVGAARKLTVTPSAVSHALARLRKAFDDELFVYSETGMAPTARAHEVYSDVGKALEHIGAALGRVAFEPSRFSSRVFPISASYYSSLVVLPPLLRRLSSMAPGVALDVRPNEPERLVAELEEGRVLLAIGQFGALADDLIRKTVHLDEEAILCRSNHPLCKRPVSWEQALSYPRVIVQRGGNGRPQHQRVDRDLRAGPKSVGLGQRWSGERPASRIFVQDYAAVPAFLEDTDLIAVGPRRWAMRVAGRLAVVEPIDRRRQIKTELVWHARGEGDEGLNWLRKQTLDGFAAEIQ
jgi:DNA-binding transcriptional LysR family regulator